ncbi:unknown [Clostridium sp. CAG:448]|nr:unknown [Clostridium sp. CAG:448]
MQRQNVRGVHRHVNIGKAALLFAHLLLIPNHRDRIDHCAGRSVGGFAANGIVLAVQHRHGGRAAAVQIEYIVVPQFAAELQRLGKIQSGVFFIHLRGHGREHHLSVRAITDQRAGVVTATQGSKRFSVLENRDMPADCVLNRLPKLGVAVPVGQLGGQFHLISDLISGQGVDLIAARRQNQGLPPDRRARLGAGGINRLDLAAHLSGQRHGRTVGDFNFHFICVIQRIIAVVHPLIVHDQRIGRRQTVQTVRRHRSVPGFVDQGQPDVRGADQRLVGVGHAECRLRARAGSLFRIGCHQVFLIDLFGCPDFMVNDKHAARHFEHRSGHIPVAVHLGHPEVAVHGCQHRLPRMGIVISRHRLGHKL